jgi:hypothetical protein
VPDLAKPEQARPAVTTYSTIPAGSTLATHKKATQVPTQVANSANQGSRSTPLG